jgi:hypothetical protein
VSRLRRQPRRSWDLSWRFLPRSSTEKLCFLSVLWNIWSIVLSSLVKVCDSIILSGKPCYPSVTPILNTFSSRWMNFWFIRCMVRILILGDLRSHALLTLTTTYFPITVFFHTIINSGVVINQVGHWQNPNACAAAQCWHRCTSSIRSNPSCTLIKSLYGLAADSSL